MNLLALLWLVGCVAACVIALAIPSEVWSAIADRIRNPRPDAVERYFAAKAATDREPAESRDIEAPPHPGRHNA